MTTISGTTNTLQIDKIDTKKCQVSTNATQRLTQDLLKPTRWKKMASHGSVYILREVAVQRGKIVDITIGYQIMMIVLINQTTLKTYLEEQGMLHTKII